MKFPHGVTITVTRPAPRDVNGDPVGPSSTHTVSDVAISWGGYSPGTQATSTEYDHRFTTVTQIQLYAPIDADIATGDHLLLPDGNTYLVEGVPSRWTSNWTGWRPGTVVHARSVK